VTSVVGVAARTAGALVLVGIAVAASCSREPDVPTTPDPVVVLDEIGEGEGELSLLAFAGYAEDGSSDPEFDWVTPFERATACSVRVRYVDSGDEMLSLLSRDVVMYDGASVPGDAAGELISSRKVAAVAPELFPAWTQVLRPLRGSNARHYVTGDHVFGVPALYGPNLLLYDVARVEPRPTSWDVVFDPGTPYAGRIAMLDSPMAIADAALYLASHEPELGIEDPYALSLDQLDAATALLQDQRDRVGLYWSLFIDVVEAFRERDVVVGTAWPIVLGVLDEDAFAAIVPAEGVTGWADTWMISADAPHPNCMLMWMRWTLNPRVQAQTAIWYGGAPSNGRACAFVRQELGGFAELADTLRFGRCGNVEFLSSLALWRTPTVECGDDRGRGCTGVPAWRLRWDSVRN
jgi:spermidine/putrescine-binding protein